jgi:hypothetical protein
MVTKSPQSKKTPASKKTVNAVSTKNAKKPISRTAKADKVDKVENEKADKRPKLDISALYGETLDTIEKRQGMDTSSLDVAPPMSTGNLQVDMITGGGIRASMVTAAGGEQCAKTTLALQVMAEAIKQEIPFIAFKDYEGCLVGSTLYGYGKGKSARLDQLFDLSKADNWLPGSWIAQQRTDIDTVEIGHTSGTSVRSCDLFYRGKMPTSTLTLANGMHLTGYAHPVFVVENGFVVQKKLEDLRPGDQVLVKS